MFPEHKENIILLDNKDLDDVIGDIQFFKAQILEIKKELEDREVKLKQKIGEAEGVDTPGFKVLWKSQAKTTMNWNKLKEDGVYDQYVIRGTTRVLRINRKKEV
jgi:hypothetical protein